MSELGRFRRAFRGRTAAISYRGTLLVVIAVGLSLVLTIPACGTSRKGSALEGLRLYVNRSSPAMLQVRSWRHDLPADAELLSLIAREPTALWFGDDPHPRRAVAHFVRAAARRHAVAQLVAYNIPDRDCGSYSAGGAPTARAYERWIRAFARGIGNHRAIVILEPDALAELGCLSPKGQRTRLALMRYAVRVLDRTGKVWVYLDAGNPGWPIHRMMARRLRAAGIRHARGFAINVANFYSTSVSERYGASISRLVGHKHFIIDTSRNGLGSDDNQWCNPQWAALGTPPTTDTGDPLVDAFLWVKYPGGSDGPCNGGPGSGQWWPQYALMLARNSVH